MRALIASIALIISSICFSQSHKSILFIGNSYTYVNDLPGMIHDLALSFNDTITYDSNCPGGYTFQMHSTNTTTLSKIKNQAWDCVILQAQSQEPSFSPSQVETDTYPYAKILNDSVKNNNLCTEVIFYMTWGRQNGDASNCAFYPPICTYDGMQARLRESYLHMADTNMATCSPVGVVWKKIREQYPSFNLYNADQSHPSVYGTYIAACVFYSTIFHKPSIGGFVPVGVSPSDATIIQNYSSSIVLDSAATWHLNSTLPQASFGYTNTGNQISFNSTSSNADSLVWVMNDGTIYTNVNSPLHQFTNPNPSVSLIAYNECGSDTLTQNITPLAVTAWKDDLPLLSVTQDELHLIIEYKTTQSQIIELIDDNGRKLFTIQTNETLTFVPKPTQGLYTLRFLSQKGEASVSKRIFVAQ